MNNTYRFDLHVLPPDSTEIRTTFVVAGELTRMFYFSPYDLCEDASTARLVDGVTATTAAELDEQRRRLASKIAARLTDEIMKVIKSRDKVNGATGQPERRGEALNEPPPQP